MQLTKIIYEQLMNKQTSKTFKTITTSWGVNVLKEILESLNGLTPKKKKQQRLNIRTPNSEIEVMHMLFTNRTKEIRVGTKQKRHIEDLRFYKTCMNPNIYGSLIPRSTDEYFKVSIHVAFFRLGHVSHLSSLFGRPSRYSEASCSDYLRCQVALTSLIASNLF